MANIREAFQYAAQNPNSDFAKNLQQLAASGSLDVEAKKNGIDLTPFKPAQPAPTPDQAAPQASTAAKTGNAVGNFFKGAYKGAANTVSNLESLGQKGLDTIAKPVTEAITGKPYQPTPTLNQTFQDTTAITPTNTAQKVGFGAEQVAEFLIPMGAEEKAAGAAGKFLEKAPKALQYAGKLAAKTAVSATTNAGITAAQGGSGQDVSSAAKLGAVFPVASDIVQGLGKTIAKAFIPTSKTEAKLLQTYKADNPFWKRVLVGSTSEAPTTAADTAFNKGLAGSESMIGVQAKREAGKLWNNLINPALKQSEVAVDMPSFFNTVEKAIVQDNPELSRQKDLLTALNALKEDYKGVGTVSLEDLQKFKEGWAKFVPEKAYQGKPVAGLFNEVKDTASDLARQTIYTALGDNVKHAYFDYGNLKGLQELGQQAMTGGRLKGGFGSFWNAIKDMALVPAGTVGGQVVYKVGRGIELYGKAGAKLVKDLLPSD